MKTVNQYCKDIYGEKLYKLSLDGGMTCPNRDGTLDTRGCIFCSAGGSGDFTPDSNLNIDEQIQRAKERISSKYHGNSFIAYFQAYSNTYASVEYLRKLYYSVIYRNDIKVLSIATRPDCINNDTLSLLSEIKKVKDIWVELGLQTINEKTVSYIRRGFNNRIYDDTITELNSLGIHTVTHMILGLPGEDENDMIRTLKHIINMKSAGIKLQLLHVLKNTDLAVDYLNGTFKTLEMDEYITILCDCLELIPENMVVHRITGDGPKRDLIAPLWSGDKKRVLNAIDRELRKRGLCRT